MIACRGRWMSTGKSLELSFNDFSRGEHAERVDGRGWR